MASAQEGPVPAPGRCSSSSWFWTAEVAGRQVTAGKAKEKLPLTSAYPKVLVLGNLQLPEIQKFKWIMHLAIVHRGTWNYELHIYY